MGKLPQDAAVRKIVALRPLDDSDPPPEVTPGPHPARYLRCERATILGRPKVLLWFSLLDYAGGVQLPRYYHVRSHAQGRIAASSASALVCEVSGVLGQRVRPDRVPVERLLEIPQLTVLVHMVATNYCQKQRTGMSRYPVISELQPGL